MSKKQLVRSYIGLIAEDGIPINILNSANMKSIINPLCEGLSEKLGTKITMNAKNTRKTLQIAAGKIKGQIERELCNQLLSLKIDRATGLSRPILEISAQFIDEAEIKSRALGIIELKGPLTDWLEYLKEEMFNIIEKFNISSRQIISITTDYGTNMLKERKRDLSQESILNFEEFEGAYENEEYLERVKMFEKCMNMDSYVGNIRIHCCAAHIAQLVALDLLKISDMKNFIINCRNLSKFLRKSSNCYKKVFELKNLRMPQLDCPTRWGSTYAMLYDLLTAKDILKNIEPIRNQSCDENFDINDSLWDFIASYCLVLGPLQKTIARYQNEQLHYGDFYAQWLKCQICTKKILENSSSMELNSLILIGCRLLESMESRSSVLLCDESLNACLYMDPRFQHILSAAKRNEAVNYLKNLWNKITVLKSAAAHHTMLADGLSEDVEEVYLNDFLTKKLQSYNSKTFDTNVYKKIECLQLPFMRSDSNILQFWQEKKNSDPELYALSNVCFAIPPTQVTLEREHSSLNLILNHNENRTKPATMENILLIKLNPALLDAAVNALPLFEDVVDADDDWSQLEMLKL